MKKLFNLKVVVAVFAVSVVAAAQPAAARVKVASGYTGQELLTGTLNIPVSFGVLRVGAGATFPESNDRDTSYNLHAGLAARALKGIVGDVFVARSSASGDDTEITGVISYIFYHNVTEDVEFGLQLRLLETRLDEKSDIKLLRGVTPLIRLRLPL